MAIKWSAGKTSLIHNQAKKPCLTKPFCWRLMMATKAFTALFIPCWKNTTTKPFLPWSPHWSTKHPTAWWCLATPALPVVRLWLGRKSKKWATAVWSKLPHTPTICTVPSKPTPVAVPIQPCFQPNTTKANMKRLQAIISVYRPTLSFQVNASSSTQANFPMSWFGRMVNSMTMLGKWPMIWATNTISPCTMSASIPSSPTMRSAVSW